MVIYYKIKKSLIITSLFSTNVIFAQPIEERISTLQIQVESLRKNYDSIENNGLTLEKIYSLWNDINNIRLPNTDSNYPDEVNENIFWMEDEIRFVSLGLDSLENSLKSMKRNFINLKIKKPISIMYLIKNSHGITTGKQAYNEAGEQTFGGVTEELNELTDFSIPLDKHDVNIPLLNLIVKPSSGSNDICKLTQFTITNDKIIPTSFPESVVTATSCSYNIFNDEKKQIANFKIILNHTFKYWCNSTNSNSETFKTSRKISYNCSIDPKINEFSYDFNYMQNDYIQNNNKVDLSPISGFININKININKNYLSYPHILNDYKKINYHYFNDKSIELFKEKNISYLLDKVEELYIALIPIENIREELFKDLLNLKRLSLYGLGTGIIPESILNIKNLESLKIYVSEGNLNRNLFKNLKKLKNLSLSLGKYDQINKNFFENLANLNELIINIEEYNKNYEIPPEFPKEIFNNLLNLEKLTIKSSQSIPLTEGMFDNLKNLKELHLDYKNCKYNLPNVSNNIFKELKLQHISLDKCNSYLSERSFRGPSEYKSALEEQKSLKSISTSSSELRPENNMKIKNISKLYLNVNEKLLRNNIFQNLNNLEEVYIKIDDPEFSEYARVPKEYYLKIDSYSDSYYISRKIFQGLNKLKRVSIDSYYLNFLARNFFIANINTLEYVDLSKCHSLAHAPFLPPQILYKEPIIHNRPFP